MADKKVKRTAKKAYKMPERITKGEILTDVKKVSWIIGNSIGIGGFGEIYNAAKSSEPKKYTYAVKIEPRENGPLFCERTVYISIGKQEDLEDFKKTRGLKNLGIPVFHGFGQHIYKTLEYRFIVIDKLGKDIQSHFEKEKRLPYPTALKIGVQILNVLEYMHSKGYVHCDVKGANLLLGEQKGTENTVYVVDFGLSCKYPSEFKPNPKKAHNGTPEYTSRDAHSGVMTRRGDVEILAYNLLHWTSGSLPWLKLTDCQEVQGKKQRAMENPAKLLVSCFKTDVTVPTAIKDFFTNICKLNELDVPDYEGLKSILLKDLKKLKANLDVLDFESAEKVETPARKKTKQALAGGDSSSQSDDSHNPKRLKRVLSPSDCNGKDSSSATRTSPRLKGNHASKRSWKDCPTILNGATRSEESDISKRGRK